MNENRTEKIAKIILTVIIFGFIMMQFIANIVTLRGACTGNVKEVKAATEINGKIFSMPQLCSNVPTANGKKALVQSGFFEITFTSNNIYISGDSYKNGPQPVNYVFNTINGEESATGNTQVNIEQDGRNTLFQANGTSNNVKINFNFNGKTEKIKYNGTVYVTEIPTRAGFSYSDEGIVYIKFMNDSGEDICYADISIIESEAPTASFTDTDNRGLYPYYTLNGSSNRTNTASYNEGYKAGIKDKEAYGNAKFQAGKAEGIATANEYTFQRLISAVFDVPVQTIYGMFNFEILGVNILNFILALATLAIVLAIVKVVL